MSRTQWVSFSTGTQRRRAPERCDVSWFSFQQLTKDVRGCALGRELLAVELIHALTRREELRFIPQAQKYFLRRYSLRFRLHDIGERRIMGSAQTTHLPTTLTL